jgi:hypothetical protein
MIESAAIRSPGAAGVKVTTTVQLDCSGSVAPVTEHVDELPIAKSLALAPVMEIEVITSGEFPSEDMVRVCGALGVPTARLAKARGDAESSSSG